MSKESNRTSSLESVDAREMLALMRKLHDPSVLPGVWGEGMCVRVCVNVCMHVIYHHISM